MSLPAISLHAPYCTLCFTHQPCTGIGLHDADGHVHPMVKRFETRSKPCPPKHRGQRVIFHQAKRPVNDAQIGDYWTGNGAWLGGPVEPGAGVTLPLGAIVGSGVIAACYPIVDKLVYDSTHVILRSSEKVLLHCGPGVTPSTWDISDQLPYGDWTPGRYAWLIEDAAPTTERCPWCWGDGGDPDSYEALVLGAPEVATKACRVCKSDGHCDPIPAVGHQGWWYWEPEGRRTQDDS